MTDATYIRDPSPEEAMKILRSGLSTVMREVAATYVMPICWVYNQEGKPFIPDNGSAFMLNTGQETLLVTAAHVYEGFCEVKAEHPDAVCMLSNIPFDLGHRRIASDKVYDIATFRITTEEVAALKRWGKIPLTGSQSSWPPAPPMVGRGVFFVGFPRDGREARPYPGYGPLEVDWNGYTALAAAEGVSDTDVTLIVQYDPKYDVKPRPAPPPDWALGGCSGAPILTLVDNNGVFSWRLAAVIYEASQKIIKASRADCLNPDGSINRYPDFMAYMRK